RVMTLLSVSGIVPPSFICSLFSSFKQNAYRCYGIGIALCHLPLTRGEKYRRESWQQARQRSLHRQRIQHKNDRKTSRHATWGVPRSTPRLARSTVAL